MDNTNWDAVVVGGGAAGLSAALMLARSRRRVLVLDGGRQRNAVAAHMHGVIGRDGWSPLDLVATGRSEVEHYGGVVRTADVAEATRSETGAFVITLTTGERLNARRLLLATGLRDELPSIPGLAERWGSGVAHCPYCDGWEVRDRRIAILARGERSVHVAQLVRQLSETVTYLTNGSPLSAEARAGLEARGIAVEERVVAQVTGDATSIRTVELVDGTALDIDAIFAAPVPLPNDGIALALGADTAEAFGDGRWVTVDVTGRTSVRGLWAAGNVVSPGATVPLSAAAGSTAGAAINADLVEEEVREAVAALTH